MDQTLDIKVFYPEGVSKNEKKNNGFWLLNDLRAKRLMRCTGLHQNICTRKIVMKSLHLPHTTNVPKVK